MHDPASRALNSACKACHVYLYSNMPFTPMTGHDQILKVCKSLAPGTCLRSCDTAWCPVAARHPCTNLKEMQPFAVPSRKNLSQLLLTRKQCLDLCSLHQALQGASMSACMPDGSPCQACVRVEGLHLYLFLLLSRLPHVSPDYRGP